MSMKKAINTVIRTKLQVQEQEEQEEQELEEQEIGVVTQSTQRYHPQEIPLNQI